MPKLNRWGHGSPTRGREFLYPWTKWFAAGQGVLYKGKDYEGQTHGMASNIRRNAARCGLVVSLTIVDDTIKFKVGSKPKKRKGKK